jgi:hypothetical protein
MGMEEWRNGIIEKATRQITFRNNMSNNEIQKLSLVLSDYLDEGISIIKKWRKLKNDDEFLNGYHDSGLIAFIKNKDNANGRELFNSYSSGGVNSTMNSNPESILKSTCKQVI